MSFERLLTDDPHEYSGLIAESMASPSGWPISRFTGPCGPSRTPAISWICSLIRPSGKGVGRALIEAVPRRPRRLGSPKPTGRPRSSTTRAACSTTRCQPYAFHHLFQGRSSRRVVPAGSQVPDLAIGTDHPRPLVETGQGTVAPEAVFEVLAGDHVDRGLSAWSSARALPTGTMVSRAPWWV